MGKIDFVLFDAANTLIHKPALWDNMQHVLATHGYNVDGHTLQYHHKLISELIFFPDRTSADFYKDFNRNLLYSLGIIPTEKMLDDIFDACTYLPWCTFDDALSVKNIGIPMGILSNFKSSLKNTVNELFGSIFDVVITSEEVQTAKPQLSFYHEALKRIAVPADRILYIGDSIKLDMEPAKAAGMQSYLIDRLDIFQYYPNRLNSLSEIETIVHNTQIH